MKLSCPLDLEKIKLNDMIDKKVVQSVIDGMHLPNFSKATIREICTIANKVEAQTGEKYVRMEMGVPGFAPDAIGTKAEIEALQRGVASKYPMLDGHPDLKKQASTMRKRYVQKYEEIANKLEQ